jgi:hypothetical protein
LPFYSYGLQEADLRGTKSMAEIVSVCKHFKDKITVGNVGSKRLASKKYLQKPI